MPMWQCNDGRIKTERTAKLDPSGQSFGEMASKKMAAA